MLGRFGRSGVVDDEVGGVPSSHTSDRMSSRIEVVARVSGRRAWSVEQKLAMLRDAFGPGGSVRASMERHEVTSGLLYTWRRQAMSGELASTPRPALLGPVVETSPCFAEVRVTERPRAPVASCPPACTDHQGRIGIELPSGVRLSVDAAVDAEALSRVLGVLAR